MTDTFPLTVTAVGHREVVMTRSFRAPRDVVFRALTTPELLARWLGPRVWKLVECDIDLCVGGSWRYLMRGPEGAEMVMQGVYLEIEPPGRLVSTESFDDNWTAGETTVTSVLTEDDGITTLTTTVRYSSPEARDTVLTSGMQRGVDEGYRRLDDLLNELDERHHV
jgi:uncharacterized protein YndB with AHSA1/START domain